MSFSDLMQSGRGPGVIGMLLALVVLVGFGLLFMFAFDEGLPNKPKRSMRSPSASHPVRRNLLEPPP
jgi:hypothetical protein